MKRITRTFVLVLLAAGLGAVLGARYAGGGRDPIRSMGAQKAPMAAAPVDSTRKVLYWWDPMLGPASISPKPGISAMGMALVPVYAAGSTAGNPGDVTIDPAIEQNLAVETSTVRFGTLHQTVHTVGYVRQATPVVYAVTLRASGWIGTLYATTDGTAIGKGDPLFTLYSPQLLAAEEEMLAAARNVALATRARDENALAEARQIFQSIRMRLVHLGVSTGQLDRIAADGRAQEYLTFLSPVSGYLAAVGVRQQSFIKGGETVMRIDQLNHVWLDAQVYDNQLRWLRLGQVLQAHLAADPGHVLEGRIFFIAPDEDPQTHTVTVRARLENSDGFLRPGMYALVDILTTPLERSLLAPASAIIHTGTGELALLAEGKGRFAPREVRTGLSGSDDLVQVLSGLQPGDRVVTSGQFLIDVESNMNEVAAKFTAGAQAPGGAMAGMKMPKPPMAAH
ncbi:RndB [Burkholderiales bacterium GJ-E10]|nr:RndB [Burkholderiales bacterium GJ-E10]